MNLVQPSQGEKQKLARLYKEYGGERNSAFASAKKERLKEQQFLAKESNEVIGMFTLLRRASQVFEIHDFYVRQEHRGKGYGEQMLSEILRFCAQNRCRKISVCTQSFLVPFFTKFGFFVEGILKDHYSVNEDAIILGLFMPREKQLNLQKKLEDISALQEIEHETAQRLKKLKSR